LAFNKNQLIEDVDEEESKQEIGEEVPLKLAMVSQSEAQVLR